MTRFIFFIIFSFSCSWCFASYVIVDSIVIEGNKKTKKRIITRELTFEAGDTIPANLLMQELKESRNRLLNTSLFNEVELNVKSWENKRVDIHISVEERWYIFPIPVFKLADRNFNVWWSKYDHDFSRTEYGVRFYHINMRGRRERLKAVFQLGFTQQFELFYTFPFIDKEQKYGLKFSGSFARNKNIAYQTQFNEEVFINADQFTQKLFYSGLTIMRRPGLYITHSLEAFYNQNTITDTIAELNPDYFINGKTYQAFLELNYLFKWDRRDRKDYPTEGFRLDIELRKKGLGIFKDINMVSFISSFRSFTKLSEKSSVAAMLKGKLSVPGHQPYYNQRGLGFEQDFVRGYELSVIDGQHYVLTKAAYRYRILSFKFKNPLIPLEKFSTIPFDIYLKTFTDAAYVSDDHYFTGNPLNNTLLIGTGFGVDISTYYDAVLRIEFSINKDMKKGLYLHFEKAI